MQIFRKTLIVESATAAILAVGASILLWPDDLGLTNPGVHPLWLAVILLGARYGPAGLLTSLGIGVGLVFGVSLVRFGNAGALVGRVEQQLDLLPLLGSIGVAWISMSQRGRLHRLSSRLADAMEQHEAEGAWTSAIQTTNKYLRNRCDRMDLSVSLWRRVARCMEGGDVGEASEAALELCVLRSNASSGCVAGASYGGLAPLAWRGLFSIDTTWALDKDKTLAAAIASGECRSFLDLNATTERDCDFAVPILDPLEGGVVGVIALRGVDPSRLAQDMLLELTVIADWVAPILARACRGQGLNSASAESTATRAI